MCILNRVSSKDCCGCGACVNICPKQCLELKEDKQGFLQPKLSKATCIECGLCEKTCPIINKNQENEQEIQAFAIKNNDIEKRINSSSGGVFTALAENIINQGGVVCAARFDKYFSVIHDFCQTKEELPAFMGSKYVQSDLKDCFKKIKSHLLENKKLLFVGTPCQVMALKLFLNKEYQNLIAAEVVCHGVPSPLVWKKYLEEVCTKKKITLNDITNISFRNKDKSWRVFNLKIESKNKTILKENLYDNLYLKTFLKNLTLRQSCHNCPAKNFTSKADISIADYWGIDRFHPEIDDNKGVSAVIVYGDKTTLEKKNFFLEKDFMNLEIKKTNLENILTTNTAIIRSAIPHPKREEFLDNFSDKNFHSFANTFVKEPTIKTLKRKIRFILSDIKNKGRF